MPINRSPHRKSPRLHPYENPNARSMDKEQNAAATATAATTQSIAAAPVTEPTTSSNAATAAAALQEDLLQQLQRKIGFLEGLLKNQQVKLNESDLQCKALKEALQNEKIRTVPVVPPIAELTPSNSSTVTQYAVSINANGSHVTVPPTDTTAIIQPPLIPTPISASSYVSATDCISSIATSNNLRSQPPPVNASNFSWFQPNSQAEEFTPNVRANNNCTSQTSFAVPRKIQDLPEFCGQAEDWPMFSTAYFESTAAYNYGNLENSQRLQKCLKGEARETVRSLLIHPENVSVVMEQLRFRFGRPEQLIRSQLRQIREIVPISENSVEKLIPFATKTKNLAVFLQSVNGHQHLSNPTLLEELIGKLPMSKRIEWAGYAAPIQPYPTIVDFSSWLSNVANLVCTVQDCGTRTITDPRRRVVLHTNENKSDVFKCLICQGRHKVAECKKFLECSVRERWTEVKQLRLCFSCLDVGHSTRNCRRRKTCGVDECQRSHHPLLHESRSNSNEHARRPRVLQPREENVAREPVLSCAASPVPDSKVLFRVLPVTLYGPKKRVETYALMDEGSSITMMDSTLIEDLGLVGHQRKLNLQWFGGRAAQEPTTVVNVHISGTTKKKHILRNVYGVSNLHLPTQSLNKNDLRVDASQMKHLSVQPYSEVKPKVLIGLDHCHLGLPVETIQLGAEGPYAAYTELGWVVFGTTKRNNIATPACLMTNAVSEDVLHELVAEYFATESFGVRPAPEVETKADVRARSILQSTTTKVNGRFQTGLLWKDDSVQLPDSYAMAKKRLIGIERKMKQDDTFAAAYNAIIGRYIEKGYARKLQPAEAAIVGPRTWYLPHFVVMNPNKPGKMRLVFDAAATVKGISLNSCLPKGPQQYQPMPTILFNFRVGAIAVCGDIREMFHQVLIQPEDRCSQRFLWRNAKDDNPPDIYEMLVMTFGAACSPCAAQYVKTINALEHHDCDPRAVKAITQHHYVDDFVDSFESTHQAIHIAKQVREIHKDGGFELRSFISNSKEVMSALECETEQITPDASRTIEESLATEKVLGMFWQPFSDTFRYQLKFHRVDEQIIAGKRCPTKRELLSVVMSLFDPLGFLAHFLICAKLLMREVWKHNIQWDDPLPSSIEAVWSRWCENLNHVINFQIPRHYFPDSVPKNLQLHIFVDASEEAFAAVAYWRSVTATGELVVAFVCAKTKCAPLKPMTIPRLELQAAVLGTRLMRTIIDEHPFDVDRCVLWSDSKTVVKWIASENRRYKPFVAHRIAEILSATEMSNWRWVSTQDNVADEATRSNYQIKFNASTRWWSGPEFLRQNEELWPVDSSNICRQEEDEEELRPKFALLTLKRTIAWVIRFIRQCRRISTTAEDNGLTIVLCRQVQAESYAVEISQIKNGQSLTKGSSLQQLSPYIDEEGILRVYGRIDAASWLPYNSKRPIILPPNHTSTQLVLHHHHCLMKHQNHEATICEVRRKFWIPRLRQVMRKVIACCHVCKIARAAPITPIMGQLPVDRLTPFVRPFSYTGLDYFGPLTVTIGRRIEKRWVALFTCLVVRAIHLEVACDLSTDACILVIRNFINRRGVPVRIRSDNGKNFVGADQEAKRFEEVFDCERIQKEMSSKGVEWLFNCPNNPSEGGVWERMVQCVKKVLRHTLREVSPREHTLQCLIIEAENVVNSRPLTHLPVSVDQEEPLTPNHFLLGSANTAQTPSSSEPFQKLCALRKQWRIARQLRDRFWKRWVAEYLPTLTRRVKWCERTTPIMEGDLVFICDPNLPRKQWCRGRVERIYRGADDEIRRADVRTSSGVLRRPVSKLAVLSLEDSESG